MALRMSSAAALALTISPLRTPRERDWPSPMILSPPWSLSSPMTAQIFEVPMSNPTMTGDELNMFFPGFELGNERRGRKSVGGRLRPAGRHVISHRQIKSGQRAALLLAEFESGLQAGQLARIVL